MCLGFPHTGNINRLAAMEHSMRPHLDVMISRELPISTKKCVHIQIGYSLYFLNQGKLDRRTILRNDKRIYFLAGPPDLP